MSRVILAGRLDVAELCFYAFVIFFIGLVYYLRREDRREGYPLEDELTGRVDSAYGPLTASTYKEFRLPFGRGIASQPTKGREPVELPARRIDRFGGAPYEPTGNPLVDGIGPAAYAQRAPWPDLDMEGRLRIVPMSADDHFSITGKDPDPRGWPIVGADGKVAGTVTDVWVDRSDRMLRYYQVTTNGGRDVLAPVGFSNVNRRRKVIEIESISAAQFEQIPMLETPGQVTRLEEDRIMGYFGGGYLYGLPGRTEPFL
jgi:photosynthetic reaction center H subunit